MHRIQKVLNHNTLIVEDEKHTYLVVGKGIGFGKKNNEYIDIPVSSTIY
ncbi:MAG: CAT RNA binding domain-containing protein, partial [Traorella sp.]